MWLGRALTCGGLASHPRSNGRPDSEKFDASMKSRSSGDLTSVVCAAAAVTLDLLSGSRVDWMRLSMTTDSPGSRILAMLRKPVGPGRRAGVDAEEFGDGVSCPFV